MNLADEIYEYARKLCRDTTEAEHSATIPCEKCVKAAINSMVSAARHDPLSEPPQCSFHKVTLVNAVCPACRRWLPTPERFEVMIQNLGAAIERFETAAKLFEKAAGR